IMIKIGLVGAGYWGKNLIRNIMESKEAALNIVCDIDKNKLMRVKKRYPGVKITTNYLNLVNDKSIDAVVISTNVNSHHNLAKKAIKNGKHVFVEKPMAETVEKAEELVELANNNKLTLMVGHTFLYSPPVIKIKEILQNNGIGKVYYISSSRVNLGIHQKDVSVIFDLAPHDFSILSYWLDEVPIKVSCIGYDYIQKGIPDVAFINLIFASGIIAHIEVSWLAPSKLRRTTIVGKKKMILYDDTESTEKVKIYDEGVDVIKPKSFGEFQLSYRVGDIVSPRIEPSEPLAEEVSHFCKCIKTGKKPRSDGVNGLEVVKVLEAAERSLHNSGGLEEIG
ncbi:Gfo/Idh/MocA family oxidoreductase, partial [candidate division WOR-3 bacterium]|nr:Gfo/Idh/MocA family oxidoreductase [candidate division WOR-3 bacterium]